MKLVKKLYIDYTRSTIVGSNKINGGANYTRTLLNHIKDFVDKNKMDVSVNVLVPNDYSFITTVEHSLFDDTALNIVRVLNGIENVQYEKGALLFIPLLPVKDYPILKQIKENKQIKIALTIHGLRNLDFSYDPYNLMYSDKGLALIKNYLGEVFLPVRKLIYRRFLRKYMGYVDTIITVSNYTLSGLSRSGQLNKVVLQYQDILPVEGDSESVEDVNGDYILFVSGNRPEKNLARSLVAYRKYIYENNGHLRMVIAGTSKDTALKLVNSTGIEALVKDRHIKFLDYVSDEELVWLYRNAYFLLYTSKSEGFGLPALEAAKYGCPTLAAYGTSIPEVLGPYCRYVNPYSSDLIAAEIKKMEDKNIHDEIANVLKREYDVLKRKSVFSTEMVIRELLS